jgi:ribulose-5-phosphate 4-epimerase/fuculose-1-phosphate aldolase
MLNGEGLLDYSGHVSVRLPGREAFLIQPLEQPRGEVTPDSLRVVDFDGVAEGEGEPPPAERFIHSEIYRARPDVEAIAHVHPDTATLFSLVDGVELAPVKNHAARWSSGIPVHPDPAHINTPELGRALAQSLGQHHAALIPAHGAVLVAENVPALFIDIVHFTENAETLYRAAALGPVTGLTQEEMASFLERFDRPRHVRKLWRYYVGRGVTSGAISQAWAEQAGSPE